MISITLESKKIFKTLEEFDIYLSQLRHIFGPDFTRQLRSRGYATIESENAKTIGRVDRTINPKTLKKEQ